MNNEYKFLYELEDTLDEFTIYLRDVLAEGYFERRVIATDNSELVKKIKDISSSLQAFEKRCKESQ